MATLSSSGMRQVPSCGDLVMSRAVWRKPDGDMWQTRAAATVGIVNRKTGPGCMDV